MYNEFTLKTQTMWSDGWFNPHRWDRLGFNEYELKHCCFGEDSQDDATGGTVEESRDAAQGGWVDPNTNEFHAAPDKNVTVNPALGGDTDDYYESDALPTPDDYEGLVAAGRVDEDEVPGLVGEAVADMIATNPYGGVGPNMSDIMADLTPQEIGFGYLTEAANPLIGRPDIKDVMDREELAQTYVDAKAESQDIGSDIASLFGFQSPVMLDPEKGFYEGTSFDPFDAPVLSMLASLNPLTGIAYGLGKGLVKNDPIGGALSMIGPYSPLAPVANLANVGLKGYNLFAETPVTLSSLAGVNSPFDLGKGVDPLTVNKFQPGVQGHHIPGYTSSGIKADPLGGLQGLGRSVKDNVVSALDNLINDPTAPAPVSDALTINRSSQMSPMEMETMIVEKPSIGNIPSESDELSWSEVPAGIINSMPSTVGSKIISLEPLPSNIK